MITSSICKSAHLHICTSFLLILFSSCSFDNDDAFYPVTQDKFLLVGDSPRQLIHIQNDEINSSWLAQQGWNAPVNDMDYRGNSIWFASGQQQELFRWDSDTETGKVFSTSPFQPHAILAGSSYFLLIDSINQRLGFWDPETASLLAEMPWAYPIGDYVHIGEKFFVQKGSQDIEVIPETTLQPAASIHFERKIQKIQVSSAKALYVLSGDSTIFESSISYFSYTPNYPTRRIGNYDRILLTPYIRSQYGKEWLGNIWYQSPRLLNRLPDFVILDDAPEFVIDFFESTILFRRNDSLYSHDLRQRSSRYLGPLISPIQKYRALKRPQGG